MSDPRTRSHQPKKTLAGIRLRGKDLLSGFRIINIIIDIPLPEINLLIDEISPEVGGMTFHLWGAMSRA